MTEDEHAVPESLLKPEAERIRRRYRMTEEEALAALADAFGERPELVLRIRQRYRREDVTRWRDYRDVVKTCRRNIYYGLRRHYRHPRLADRLLGAFERAVEEGADGERLRELRQRLLRQHISTRERLEHLGDFHDRLFELAGAPGSVLDLGCGLYPLCYPFASRGRTTRTYVAVDDDERSMRAVRAHARTLGGRRLEPVHSGLQQALAEPAEPLPARFDLALMLKLVPLLQRREPETIKTLAVVPADRILVTGSVVSMTRRQSVEGRERGVLRRFIAQCGRRVTGELRLPTEFGYLLE